MASQLVERRDNPVAVFRQNLDQMADQLKMALPSHISVEKFQRVATTAVQNAPALLDGSKCDRRSLFGALVKAAQDGLLPDGREGAIVPYRGKAQWQPMVAGIMKKVRNSGEVATWDVAAVYEKDKFQRLLGDDQRIYHEPFEEGDPGQVVGAYSIVTFKDGTKSRDYMPRWRIEKARAQGMARDSLMWSQFYDEGAIKTVIKHHGKRLPMSTDVEAAFSRDDTMTSHIEEAAVRLVSTPPADAEVEPASRLDALEHQIEGHDTITPDSPHAEEGMADDDRGGLFDGGPE
jgi:recombination protein RecT